MYTKMYIQNVPKIYIICTKKYAYKYGKNIHKSIHKNVHKNEYKK